MREIDNLFNLIVSFGRKAAKANNYTSPSNGMKVRNFLGQGDCKVPEGSAGGKPAGVLGVSPNLNLLPARVIAKYLLPRKRYFAIALLSKVSLLKKQ